MLKIQKLEKFLFASSLTLFYSCLSLWYFTALDQKLYAKDVFKCGLAFANPLPYVFLVALFVFAYSVFLKQKPRTVVFPVIAMAAILPLFYLLVTLKIEMSAVYPYGGNRGIYGVYAGCYMWLFIAFFSVLCGTLFRKLFKGELSCSLALEDLRIHNIIFHLPVVIYFVYCLILLFVKGFYPHASCALLFFLTALLCEKASDVSQKLRALFIAFTRKEKLFLVSIFAVSFFVRYLWGARLLGLTGENFLLASDDGVCYDKFALILAGGGLIPKEGIFAVSGFSYWYFLAGVYKIFGAQNFKALIVIQSFIGAFVPVFTYFICKKALKARFAPVLAAIITSFDMILVFLSVTIGMEALYIPLITLGLVAGVYFLSDENPDLKKAFFLGAAFGLAYNARPPILLFWPFVVSGIIYFFMKKSLRKIKLAGIIASLLTGFILLISVQHIMNYVDYGERPGMQAAATVVFHETKSGHTFENAMLGEMGFSPFEDLKGSVRVLMRNPAAVSYLILKGSFKRLIILYFFPNFGVFDPFCLVNPGSGYVFGFPLYMQFYAYLLIAAGIFTAFVKNKKRDAAGTVFLLLFLGYISIQPALFYVLNARYRAPIVPVFILFFAYGVEIFYEKIRNVYATKRLS